MKGIIYLIENKINLHKYVGQTRQSLEKRWKHHLTESKSKSQRPLYRALNKYGIENFELSVLEECAVDDLNEREMYWINHFNTFKSSYGYNATSGGEGGEILQEVKDRISKTMSELPRGEKWEQSMSVAMKEKIEKGEKWGFMLNRCDGKHSSRKIKGTPVKNLKGNAKIKPISDEPLIFNSCRDAARKLTGKSDSGAIASAIKHGWIAYGYTWEKLDNTPVKRKVYGVNKTTGEKTEVFESIKAAAKKWDKRDGGIRKALQAPGVKSFMGHYWYFA